MFNIVFGVSSDVRGDNGDGGGDDGHGVCVCWPSLLLFKRICLNISIDSINFINNCVDV